jgi:hypothetical protein
MSARVTRRFSPDGLSIAFAADNDNSALKRIGVTGGTPVTLSPRGVSSISWGADGITFQPTMGTEQRGPSEPVVFRVSPNGGQPEVLVRIANDEYAAGAETVANGEVVLFTRIIRADTDGTNRFEQTAQIVAQSIRTGERHVLLTGASNPHYLPTGHLVYTVGGTLYAVRLDLARLAIVGNGTPVIEGVQRGIFGGSQYSISESGSLIYLPGPLGAYEQISNQLFVLTEVDRSGRITPLKLASGPYGYPRYSPDGRQVAVQLVASGGGAGAPHWHLRSVRGNGCPAADDQRREPRPDLVAGRAARHLPVGARGGLRAVLAAGGRKWNGRAADEARARHGSLARRLVSRRADVAV